jgi:hypothetical protein
VFVGQPASFSVTASGTPPLSYRWRFNTTNIVGATNATLLLANAQFTNAGNYTVIVSNVVNSILSSNAVLTVNPPSCDPPPAGLVSWWAAEGNALDQISGNNGILAGNTSYGPGKVGQGFVFDGNGSGVQVGGTTNLWLQNLTIETWIKRASASVVSGSGGNATIFGYGTGAYLFGINSAGNLFFSQQGNFAYVSGPAITDTNFHHVAVSMVGSTVVFYLDRVAYATPAYSVTFTFTGGPPGIGFWAERGDTGFLGTIDELSVYNRALSPTEIQGIYNAGSRGKCFTPVPPSITSQPTNQTVFAGQTASFSVSASGTPPLSYQWRFNTTNLVGATNTTLILANAQLTNAGNYTVLVSNVVNSILSSNAVLTVNTSSCDPPPAGLVSWWAAEGNALDQISGNNGTLAGSASYGSGEVGHAFVFTGNDGDGVVLGNPTNLQLQNFSIEAWVKRASTSSVSQSAPNAELFSYGLGGYAFGVWSDGRLYLSKMGIDNVTLSTGISDTNWHHVAVSKNGSAVVFYIDGTAYNVGPYASTFVFTTPAAIGTTGDNLQTSFYGVIDELSVYNRALSPSEIQGIYNAGSAGKCFTPVPPSITSQPTNQTVFVGQTASFSVTASGTPPLSYQWRFNTTNLVGATNTTLILPSAQFTNAGIYSVLVSNVVNSILSSNALLTVKDILDHFTWGQIPSPRFMNAPFTVVIQARGTTNGLFTNFTGTVFLGSTNGIPIDPPVSASFVQGAWTGAVTVSRLATNLVMRADDGAGQSGLANPINILKPPALDFASSGNFLLIFWPVASSNFVLETSAALSPAQWVQVASPPLQIGDQYLESMQMNSSNQFYRLRFTGH